MLERIKRTFKQEQIPFLVFKGVSIASLYPVSALRTMGDCDILVQENDKNRAGDLLLKLGARNVSKGNNAWVYQFNDMEIELHHGLLYERIENSADQKKFADKVWHFSHTVDGIEYIPESEFYLVYLLLHIKLHMLAEGIGFRQFLDVAFFAQQNLNWTIVKCYLEESNILMFAQTCFALCEKWFDTKIEMAGNVSWSFLEESTNQIFANGVFGFNNKENIINRTSNEMRCGKKSIFVFLNRIFPSYTYMSYIPAFSFVRVQEIGK